MALTDSMTAYWSLEDNAANTTVVDDHSTNDGTASTNTTNLNVTGKVNDGMHFDGSSENINMGNYNDMKTISFWFKVGDSSGGDIFIAGERLRSTELAGDWDCRIFNDGTIVIDWFTPTGKFIQGSVADDGAWHHLVIVSGSGGLKMYLDGNSTPDASDADTTVFGASSLDNFTIGSAGINTVVNFGLCDMDEVGLWTRRITTTEIAELYNSGAGLAYPFTVAAAGNSQMFGANF